MGGSSKKTTVGYEYRFDAHMAICHGPVDKVTQIYADRDKPLLDPNQTPVLQSTQLDIGKLNLFGGESREGGQSGFINVQFGEPTQQPHPFLASLYGALVPAFRGVLTAIFKPYYWGNNPYIKTVVFDVTRIETATGTGGPVWYSSKANVNGAMNPAVVLYELLTNNVWGMGRDAQELNEQSFIDAADALHAEGFGISLLWTQEGPIQEFVDKIIDHIEAALYADMLTGKITLKLLRDDYDINTLPVLDERVVLEIDEFKQPTNAELTNSVTVKYHDYETDEAASVTMRNEALLQQTNKVVGTTIQLPGIDSNDLAAKVCARELQNRSTPLVSCRLICNRKVTILNPGDAFVLNNAKFGVSNLVMRVISMGLGDPNNNQITITATQDLFGISNAIFATPPRTEWVNPVNAPAPAPDTIVRELNYYELAQRYGDGNAAAVAEGDAYACVTAIRPDSNPDGINMKIVMGTNSNQLQEAGYADFAQRAELTSSVNYTDLFIPIENQNGFNFVEVGNYCQIDNEFMEITAITPNQLTVKRGVIDSIPEQHLAGAIVYIWEQDALTDEILYTAFETIHAKALPITGLGQLDEQNGILTSEQMTGRAFKPYPPANVRINGLYFPSTMTGDLTINWAGRNRITQTGGLIGWYQPNITPEDNTEYHLVIKNENNVILLDTNVTTTTYTYTTAQETADHSTVASGYIIELTTVRDATIESEFSYVHAITRV